MTLWVRTSHYRTARHVIIPILGEPPSRWLARIYDGSSVHSMTHHEEPAWGVGMSRSFLIPVPSRFPD
jgi:hypothetical protein